MQSIQQDSGPDRDGRQSTGRRMKGIEYDELPMIVCCLKGR